LTRSRDSVQRPITDQMCLPDKSASAVPILSTCGGRAHSYIWLSYFSHMPLCTLLLTIYSVHMPHFPYGWLMTHSYSMPNAHVSRDLSHSFSASQLRHSPRSAEISELRSPSTSSRLRHKHPPPLPASTCRTSPISQLPATPSPKEITSSGGATPASRHGMAHHPTLSPMTSIPHARRPPSLAALPHSPLPLTAPSSLPSLRPTQRTSPALPRALPLLATEAIAAAEASQRQLPYGPHLLHGVHLLPVPSALLSQPKLQGRVSAGMAPCASAPTMHTGGRAATAALPSRLARSSLMPPPTA